MEAREELVLEVLARDIDERPDVPRPVDAQFVGRLRALVAGVEVDLDQPLPLETGGAGKH